MLARLQEEYQYDGIETCAGDGTCAIPCPIGINTGALIREFRAIETTPTADTIALRLAKNWSAVEKVSRANLSATHAFSALFGVKPLTGP
jgi:D-lactate dehydrogenase